MHPATQPSTASTRCATLEAAILHGDAAAVRELIRADPNCLKLTDPQVIVLGLAITPEVASVLLAAGVNPNTPTRHDMTPLSRAVVGGRKDVVAVLLAAGADVNAEDNLGTTPLKLAQECENKEIEAMLRAAGAREPSAKTLKRCPDGHERLRDVPIAYGYIVADEEFRKMEANHEVIRGGCVLRPTKSLVLCLACDFHYDTYFNYWSRTSPDSKSFRRAFSPVLLELPLPADAGSTYEQQRWRNEGFAEIVWFHSAQGPDELCDRVCKYLKGRGVQTEAQSSTYSDDKSWDITGKLNGKPVHVVIAEHKITHNTSVHFQIGERR